MNFAAEDVTLLELDGGGVGRGSAGI